MPKKNEFDAPMDTELFNAHMLVAFNLCSMAENIPVEKMLEQLIWTENFAETYSKGAYEKIVMGGGADKMRILLNAIQEMRSARQQILDASPQRG